MVKYDYKMRYRGGDFEYYINRDGIYYDIMDGKQRGRLSQEWMKSALGGKSFWELVSFRPRQLENK